MPTVLRNGRKVPHVDEEPSPMTDSPRSESTRYPPSAWLLVLYPVVLATGSLFSVLSPVASSQDASDHRHNYFAGKRNFINLYFVKLGWFWTTVAFGFLQSTNRSPSSSKSRHYSQAFTRFAIVTMVWYLTTQWFFGPALIDRSFTITGGHCESPPLSELSDFKESITFPTIASATYCKAKGGRWRGGHDISGHIFMLVLSSACLVYELYIADSHSAHPHVSPAAAAKLAHDLTDEERKAVGGWESETAARVRMYARYFLWGVVALDVWMIMMTAIWFHTWLEKLSGLVLAAAAIWGVYFLPEAVPGWRTVVGGFE
ncbi:uncharacterized protein HMPREF1541_07721 [Cyphellophora europaea CBS 101466]|uniref:Acyl-coenzyme A diphosphatase SCS3 n=1 Tax=Cyphellophora europaea (strain CBS 101466) TaxID=1220924 RepID=W2RNQ3_CYPE1|nr:uncharacterized protein HMPREF1541_07721 [Cyphellophora europaea CBS 101466]ETN38097.1 hypothetical protein HMPREF1541_07721 [Cyphellophora europaea CBS 101466]